MLEDYYFTSKIEIKPQPSLDNYIPNANYFTSKIEIKPQPWTGSES